MLVLSALNLNAEFNAKFSFKFNANLNLAEFF